MFSILLFVICEQAGTKNTNRNFQFHLHPPLETKFKFQIDSWLWATKHASPVVTSTQKTDNKMFCCQFSVPSDTMSTYKGDSQDQSFKKKVEKHLITNNRSTFTLTLHKGIVHWMGDEVVVDLLRERGRTWTVHELSQIIVDCRFYSQHICTSPLFPRLQYL